MDHIFFCLEWSSAKHGRHGPSGLALIQCLILKPGEPDVMWLERSDCALEPLLNERYNLELRAFGSMKEEKRNGPNSTI